MIILYIFFFNLLSAGIHEEHLCGRPLGLRIRNDILYIADAYYGIFSHVIADGKFISGVFSPDVKEQNLKHLHMWFQDLVNSTIYWDQI